VREVRTLFVNNGALQARIASREADLARARSEVARAEDDVRRREPLVQSGAVGRKIQSRHDGARDGQERLRGGPVRRAAARE
jgi:multidrug resistance efflux pump